MSKKSLIFICICLLSVGIFFFVQWKEKYIDKMNVKYVSLPEEISQAKEGDTLTANLKDDTLFIRFYNKHSDKNCEKIILKP